MITGMRTSGHHLLLPEASDCVSGGVELSKRGEGRVCSDVAVRRSHGGKMHTCGGHIGCGDLHIAEIMIDSRCVGADIPIAKMSVDHTGREQLHLMSGRDRREIVLESLQINWSVRRNIRTASRSKEQLARRCVWCWQRQRNDTGVEWHR